MAEVQIYINRLYQPVLLVTVQPSLFKWEKIKKFLMVFIHMGSPAFDGRTKSGRRADGQKGRRGAPYCY